MMSTRTALMQLIRRFRANTTRYSQNRYSVHQESVHQAMRRAAAHACCAVVSANDAVARVDHMPSRNWWRHQDSASKMMQLLLMTTTKLMLMMMVRTMTTR